MAALPPRVRATIGLGRAARWATTCALVVLTTVVLLAAHPGTAGLPAQPGSGTPARIVSFVPAVTEMLFAMGAGDRVVGASSYDRFPPAVASIPKVGGLLDPNVERVLSLRPDLVVVYGTQRDLRAQLDRAGIAQYEYVHRGLDDVMRTMREVGARVGAASAAERLAANLERELAAVRQQATGLPRPRTLLVFGREAGSLRRIHASGGYGFLHDLLQLAGGDDVLGEVRRESVEMSTETVLGRAPEVIIELRYGRALNAGQLAGLARDWDVLPGVPAVRSRRVFVLQGDEFVVPGPRVIEAARALAAALRQRSPQ